MFPKCAHVFLKKARRGSKTHSNDTRQCVQATSKIKNGFPVFKLRNNFKKMRNKKQRKKAQIHTKRTPKEQHY